MSRAVALRYARALHEVALEKKIIDAVEQELSAISEVVQGNPDLQRVLTHPQIATEEKKQLLDTLFAGKVKDETKNFLFLLVDRGREIYLKEITSAFIELANEARGIADATVTSAKPLDGEALDELAERFGKQLNKTLRLQAKVDPSIIGGLVIRIGDRLYDGSVAGKLAQFQQQLKQTQVR